MRNKLSLRIVSVLLVIITLAVSFAACSDKNDKDTDADETSGYAADWVIEPTISAQAIEPLVNAVFNENTNHYDINFADCFAIMINSKYGIIDFNGQIVLDAEYDEIIAVRDGDDFVAIKYNDDQTSEQVYVHSDTFDTQDSYKKYNTQKYEYCWDVRTSSPVLVSNVNGKTSETDIEAMLPESVKGVAGSAGSFKATGKYGLLVNGVNITGLVYTNAGVFNNGLVAFESNGSWGYLNSDGHTVIPFDYDAVWGYSALGGEDTAYESSEGHVTVCKNKKFGILKDDGSVVVPLVFEGATPVVDGKAFVKQNGKWGVISVYGENDPVYLNTTATTSSTTFSEQSSSEEDTTSEEDTSSSTETTTRTTTTTTTTTTTKTTTTTTTTTTTKSNGSYTAGNYVVTADSVNLRSGPSADNELVTTLYKGARIYVEKVQGGWGYTVYKGKAGWFRLSYAEKY